ncbi:Protein kinase-like domain [Pseudocohnilembus persalinus]|uniref:Protein kinase-like domain n=1 Tax=Pseudocohnilembus persalinus TaxID=266149 RepID=A0A0V0R0E7_PSEPJ|nr:Protein kinase-like domain [Pseudocohnilembus persalinus]|eukprot:KRX08023.1 Protein kinase-like domain [Pseudocohnilembus persalinus]
MHKHKIMHRNINPGSIYFQSPDSNEIILEDFDFAVEYQKGEHIEGQIYLEDDHYKAPEISQTYTQSCDIWSIGMLTFYLLTGTYPQLNENGGVQDLQKEFSTQLWQQISKEAQEFIEQTLKSKPSQRPSANQLLKSKWMIKCQRIQDDSYLPNLTQALCNINNFSRGNKLRQAVYKYLTANLMSKDEIKHLKQVFLSMDKTGDGTLSKQELKDGYKQIHVLVDDEDIDYVFSQLENNQNQIYFKDWLQIASKQEQIVSRQRLEEAFKLFDDNNDGKLSVDELKILFTDHNIIKDTTWTQLIQQFDKNNDGEQGFSKK